jgi:hypothetical protein
VRYMPSATAAWRLNLLRSGGLPDAQLAGIRCAASCRKLRLHMLWPRAAPGLGSQIGQENGSRPAPHLRLDSARSPRMSCDMQRHN